MLDELVYPQDISPEMLFELLEQAYVPCTLDSDGDLVVLESIPTPTLVVPSKDGKQLYLQTAFPGTDAKTLEEKAEIINKLNAQKKMLRAVVEEDFEGHITIDYLINLDGGVTKANLVRTIRLFTTFVGMMATTPEMQEIIA